MDRVALLLDPNSQEHSYRQALVRLWTLASNDQVLNSWEQRATQKTIPPHVAAFLDQLQNESAVPRESIEAQPLALIRALDDYLASVRPADSRSTTTSQKSYVIEEDGKEYWLVAVPLAARRHAAMNRQPAQLARWFHHHAVLPARTAHGIEVTTSLSRSRLNTTLEMLSSQADAKLKAWVAHFDDGADVVWDRTSSPVENWRTAAVEPHADRQNSVFLAIKKADELGAQVVVFPEFTLDLNHRHQLTEHLRREAPQNIQLVVAGAFHEPVRPSDPSVAFNTAPVLTGNGHKLFEHRKLRLFGSDEDGAEFVEVGNQLHVLVTPIGCMTVLICKDFMDKDPRVDNLLAEVPVDWVWVPSYGNDVTLRNHKVRAKELATVTTGTSCAVAQTQNTAMRKPGEPQALLPGFGHAAGQAAASDVPETGGLVEFGLEKQPSPSNKPPALRRVK